jgi:hypothetical protein
LALRSKEPVLTASNGDLADSPCPRRSLPLTGLMFHTFRYGAVLLALVRAWSVQKGWSDLCQPRSPWPSHLEWTVVVNRTASTVVSTVDLPSNFLLPTPSVSEGLRTKHPSLYGSAFTLAKAKTPDSLAHPSEFEPKAFCSVVRCDIEKSLFYLGKVPFCWYF